VLRQRDNLRIDESVVWSLWKGWQPANLSDVRVVRKARSERGRWKARDRYAWSRGKRRYKMIVCGRTRHLFSRKYSWRATRDFLAELRLQELDRPGGVESDSDSVLCRPEAMLWGSEISDGDGEGRWRDVVEAELNDIIASSSRVERIRRARCCESRVFVVGGRQG
ncbi:hypothetical protein BU15DRAFT_61498, partial [Melanogaster broomeanus]